MASVIPLLPCGLFAEVFDLLKYLENLEHMHEEVDSEIPFPFDMYFEMWEAFLQLYQLYQPDYITMLELLRHYYPGQRMVGNFEDV